MHILQLNTEKGWRGGERQTLLSMMGLRDAGVEVTLLCLRDRPLFTKACAAGFSVIGMRNQREAFWYLLTHAKQYTALHAQSSRIFGFAAFATVIVPVPLVYTRRVDFVPRGAITRWKYHRASLLIAVSDAIRTILHNAAMGEAHVISDMVSDHVADADRCSKFRAEQKLDGKRVVGVVAALVGHKDPCTMIKAAAIVKKAVPDVVFLHFGEGGLLSVAQEECAACSLGESYRLLGYLNDVEDFFPLFDCFAMSSKEEGLGSTVLDAFVNRVPVASTAAGGLFELVKGHGLLSPPEDPEALAENIITLLENRVVAENVAAQAAAYVNEFHARKTLTQRNIDLYRTISHVTP